MGFKSDRIRNKTSNSKKSSWLTVVLIIIGTIILANIASVINMNIIEKYPPPLTQKKILEIEQSRKEEEFNINLENSVRTNVGTNYGVFNIKYNITSSSCHFTLTFDNYLTDEEARTAGTLAVKALLNNYVDTSEIDDIMQGFMRVSVWIYSMKPLSAGELRGPSKEEIYMGMAIYRWKTDQIEWTHKWRSGWW